MSTSTLQEELLRLDGVAEAEVDAADGAGPAGVRVRLSPDADAEAVGAEVQRVLAAHGMRSRLAGADRHEATGSEAATSAATPTAESPTAESEVSSPAAGGGSGEKPEPAAAPPPVATPEPTSPPAEPTVAASAVPESAASPPASEPEATEEPASEPAGTPAAGARLSSLRLDETADGVTVTATTSDGRSITQRSENTERSAFEAVVAAVGALAEGAPPALLALEQTTVDGSEVFTVIVERRDGSRHAGAAVVRAARPYAVAAATWAALGA